MLSLTVFHLLYRSLIVDLVLWQLIQVLNCWFRSSAVDVGLWPLIYVFCCWYFRIKFIQKYENIVNIKILKTFNVYPVRYEILIQKKLIHNFLFSQAIVKDVLLVFCEMVQTVLQPDEFGKLTIEKEKKMKHLVPWLPSAVKSVRYTWNA